MGRRDERRARIGECRQARFRDQAEVVALQRRSEQGADIDRFDFGAAFARPRQLR